MGNTVQTNTIKFYNSTPYVMLVSIDRRQYVNEPWFNRVTSVEQVSSDHLFVEVRLINFERTLVLKQTTFFTDNNQSWIASDTEIRRQRNGYPPYVADDWSTETKEDKKHFEWSKVSTDKLIYDNRLLRPDVDYVPSSAGNEASAIKLYNDSPFFLDITVEHRPTGTFSRSSSDKTEIRFYRSDPHSESAAAGRLVRIDSGGDRYPLIHVTALAPRVSESTAGLSRYGVKRVEFYARRGTAWIVTDECVVQQAGRGQPPYVASVFDDSKGEVATGNRLRADLWTIADRIKRYDWAIAESSPVASTPDQSAAEAHSNRTSKTNCMDLLSPVNAALAEARNASVDSGAAIPHGDNIGIQVV